MLPAIDVLCPEKMQCFQVEQHRAGTPVHCPFCGAQHLAPGGANVAPRVLSPAPGARQTQAQLFCPTCDRLTLHARRIAGVVPHGLYAAALVLSLLGVCFPPLLISTGVIVLVWMVHAACAGETEPFRCQTCGAIALPARRPPPPPEEEARQRAEWDALQRRRAEQDAELKARQDAELKAMLAACRLLGNRIKLGLLAVPRTPAWIDGLLKRLAGDGNTILHGFFRALLIGGACLAAGALAMALR